MNSSIAEINSNAEAEYLLNTFGGPDLRRSPWIKLTIQKVYGERKGEALAARLVHVNGKNIGVFENTTEQAPYICERQSFQVCWEGWKETGNRCFEYFSTRRDFLSAEAVCRKHNSHLASIHSKEEFDRLMKYVRRTYRYYGVWIGLSIKNGVITWTDKKPL
ncbi:type-2 ice-structuring protein-like [Lineus longissimus]|uniref:type-2 ice-structuring protein-like n=1 Tax=Lineus longissimus TaxID=88925 RepID=UPI00315C8E59